MIVELVSARSILRVVPGRCRIAFNVRWRWRREPQYFLWACPVCGQAWSGWLTGPKPSPFDTTWTLTGTHERPTLSPSLVCAMSRPEVANGRPLCPGHGTIQDGEWRAA